jgi:ArsR family transcriptional regulator
MHGQHRAEHRLTRQSCPTHNVSTFVEISKHSMPAEKSAVLQVFEALSSGVRLDVFRLLVQAGATGRVAGEIAATLDVPPTNLSFHLKTLLAAGLVSVEQEGRFQRYRANIPLMLDTIAYLTAHCCGDDAEECARLRDRVPGIETVLPKITCAADTGCKA